MKSVERQSNWTRSLTSRTNR